MHHREHSSSEPEAPQLPAPTEDQDELVRLSLSIEKSLFSRLEAFLSRKKQGNRSEFLRDLIRDRLVEEEWAGDEEVVGSITMIFDHHARDLQRRLTQQQHEHHESILATTHLHLSHDICLEVILTRGSAGDVKHLFEHLRQQKGVLHATLSMSSTGDKLR